MIIYKCDPKKNKNCNKYGCYINNGPCQSTSHIEAAKLDQDGKPIKSDGEEWDKKGDNYE